MCAGQHIWCVEKHNRFWLGTCTSWRWKPWLEDTWVRQGVGGHVNRTTAAETTVRLYCSHCDLLNKKGHVLILQWLSRFKGTVHAKIELQSLFSRQQLVSRFSTRQSPHPIFKNRLLMGLFCFRTWWHYFWEHPIEFCHTALSLITDDPHDIRTCTTAHFINFMSMTSSVGDIKDNNKTT